MKLMLRIIGIYLVVSIAWITLSNALMLALVEDETLLAELSVLKDIFFVVAAALLLTVLLRQAMSAIEQTQRSLLESEQRFHSTFYEAPVGMTLVGTDLNFLSANKALCRMLGYTEEELKALSFVDITHPDDVAVDVRLTEELFEGEIPGYQLVKRYITKSGEVLWVRLTAAVVRDPAGEVTCRLGMVEDISESRRVEESRRAMEIAEAANRAKSEFLSRMSHELRTPLNSILGFAQLLEMGNPTPEQRESLQHILRAGRHLLDLISEVLDISRIETGRLSLSPEPVRVIQVLQECMDLMRPLATRSEIKLRLHEAQACHHSVLADRQRLSQVLLNLLSNAVKYNRKGGEVLVACAGVASVPSGGTPDHAPALVRVTVSDTGYGIPPEKLDRLFLPFERLHTQHESVEGTGLGLALSKHLVEAMSGSIGVSSVEGQGSDFWVELPLAPPRALDEAPADVPSRGHDTHTGPRVAGAYTVLYIEDDVPSLRLMERILTQRPFLRLITATNVEEGLEQARRHAPDLILLDLHLREQEGLDVLHSLSEWDETAHVPVIIISGEADDLEKAGVHDDRIRAFVQKPLDVRQFLLLLDNTLADVS